MNLEMFYEQEQYKKAKIPTAIQKEVDPSYF
jgi:hypothetical protein